MRYNTKNKRLKIRTEMIEYLIEYPQYKKQGAEQLTDMWIENGIRWLSECLIISDDACFTDEDVSFDDCRIWSNIRNYQVTCPVQEILDNGFIDFYLE